MKKIFFFISIFVMIGSINAQDTLQQYTGKYSFPGGSVVPEVEVTFTDGALFMSSVAGTSSLVQSGVDSFTITEFNGLAVFKRGEDKNVNAVYIEAMGYILEGKKQVTAIWVFSAFIHEKKDKSLSASK